MLALNGYYGRKSARVNLLKDDIMGEARKEANKSVTSQKSWRDGAAGCHIGPNSTNNNSCFYLYLYQYHY
jgi:hypothetical protein